jgi:Mor family transcriptional regulator
MKTYVLGRNFGHVDHCFNRHGVASTRASKYLRGMKGVGEEVRSLKMKSHKSTRTGEGSKFYLPKGTCSNSLLKMHLTNAHEIIEVNSLYRTWRCTLHCADRPSCYLRSVEHLIRRQQGAQRATSLLRLVYFGCLAETWRGGRYIF